jgi:heat-inducible transcriptional repressor
MSHLAFPGRLSQDDPRLSARQRQVFLAVVRHYGRTARPVGSESLATLPGIRGSAASIRSVLAELERMGLLTRVHAASGRVPSGRGYG